MQGEVDISVIIGFKDWGVERLLLSINSIFESFGDKCGEVIVSDFGSETFAPGALRDLIEESGAVYVRTETDGTWSRSRAVNAGYSASKGAVVVATDADMLFTPKSMAHVADAVLSDPTSAVVLQCRDLPEGYDHNRIASGNFSPHELHHVSQIRPRWGMGGMFAAHREVIAAVGGYDNRMHTYGGEDLDLAVRVRKSGRRIRWIEHDEVRMYHIWHEPTIKTVQQDAAATEAVQANRMILQNDPTWKRNAMSDEDSDIRISWAQETVSVITPTSEFRERSFATFTLITPVEVVPRIDMSELVSQQLDSKNRAVVGQIVAFKTPESRTAPVWEVDFRLPVLLFDTRFEEMVAPYFQGGSWDILGAARRLQAAGVRINPSSEVFGVVDPSREVSVLAQVSDWQWNFAVGLFPKRPGTRGISELVENLALGTLAKILPATDLRISSDSMFEGDIVESITNIANEWSLSRNLLTGVGEFEAIVVNASESQVSAIQEIASTVDINVSRISLSEASSALGRLSATDSAVQVIEGLRSSREGDIGAIQVSWLDNPNTLDEGLLKEARIIGGDFVDIQNADRHVRVWVAPNPLMDVAGNVVSSLIEDEFFQDWKTGVFGPSPIESLIALGGRL